MTLEVRVRLFGAFRKYGDGAEIRVRVPELSGPAELKDALGVRLRELHPGFSEDRLLADSVIADDARVLDAGSRLTEGTAVAVLPPVCGG